MSKMSLQFNRSCCVDILSDDCSWTRRSQGFLMRVEDTVWRICPDHKSMNDRGGPTLEHLKQNP